MPNPTKRTHKKFNKDDLDHAVKDQKGVVLYKREGRILSQAAHNYIRRLQVQQKLRGKTLRNTFIEPTPPLNWPVFIGENGEPISLYKKNRLGKGSFGEVFLGINMDTGKTCVVKIQNPKTEKEKTEVIKEGKILKAMDSYIDKLEITRDGIFYEYGVQELAWGDNLLDYMKLRWKHNNPLSPEELSLMGSEINRILDDFHQRGYSHRDIKLENIMWDEKTKKATLIDVGLAKKRDDEGNCFDEKMTGTLLFMDPALLDIIKQRNQGDEVGPLNYNDSSEMYSIGMVMAILCSPIKFSDIEKQAHNNPLSGDFTKFAALLKNAIPNVYDEDTYSLDEPLNEIEIAIKKMIRRMSSHDISVRPSFEEAREFFEIINQGYANKTKESDIADLLKPFVLDQKLQDPDLLLSIDSENIQATKIEGLDVNEDNYFFNIDSPGSLSLQGSGSFLGSFDLNASFSENKSISSEFEKDSDSEPKFSELLKSMNDSLESYKSNSPKTSPNSSFMSSQAYSRENLFEIITHLQKHIKNCQTRTEINILDICKTADALIQALLETNQCGTEGISIENISGIDKILKDNLDIFVKTLEHTHEYKMGCKAQGLKEDLELSAITPSIKA